MNTKVKSVLLSIATIMVVMNNIVQFKDTVLNLTTVNAVILGVVIVIGAVNLDVLGVLKG